MKIFFLIRYHINHILLFFSIIIYFYFLITKLTFILDITARYNQELALPVVEADKCIKIRKKMQQFITFV